MCLTVTDLWLLLICNSWLLYYHTLYVVAHYVPSKGVFTPVVFNLFILNSGSFSTLVQFVCADVNTVISLSHNHQHQQSSLFMVWTWTKFDSNNLPGGYCRFEQKHFLSRMLCILGCSKLLSMCKCLYKLAACWNECRFSVFPSSPEYSAFFTYLLLLFPPNTFGQ